MSTPRVGLVTDSNAQLPDELVARYGVEVVPLKVVLDGEVHEEGVDLDADTFYARLGADPPPTVSTSQPSPGRFLEAYERLAERGVDAILGVHLGASVSGTLQSARLAAAESPVPVRLVDTGTASFGIACCLWEAAEALARGATLEEAARVGETLAALIGNVFVVQAVDLVNRAAGGRVSVPGELAADAIPVLTLLGGTTRVVAQAADADEAADVMADYVTAGGSGLRVAVGVADRRGEALGAALEARLTGHPAVIDLVRYRVGPSVGAHTGPGVAGAFFFETSTGT